MITKKKQKKTTMIAKRRPMTVNMNMQMRCSRTFLAQSAHVEHLTAALHVGVVTADHLSLAGKLGFRQRRRVHNLQQFKFKFEKKISAKKNKIKIDNNRYHIHID